MGERPQFGGRRGAGGVAVVDVEPMTESVAFTWGTLPPERAEAFPCDAILPGAEAAYFRGVTVHASAPVVFRWLCQLRVAPYSYDWIDNGGRPSPRTLTPGLEQLAIGQTVMTMFKLVSFETDQHFTIQSFLLKRVFGDVAVSYRVHATDTGQTRLLAKLLVRYPHGPMGWLIRAVLPWGDWLMMRKQLLTLKHLSETPRT
ncbi:MAG: hypothetical protein ACT4QE_01040 [Anaerolineales bacterium]